MNINKIRKFCKPFRITLGLSLIIYGAYSSNYWFLLGAVPLVIGILNICPLCKITGQCDIFDAKK